MKPTPTVVNLECAVKGCGARFSIPVVYRLEPVPYPPEWGWSPELAKRHDLTTRVVVDVDATLELEAPLRVHLDEHATCGAPPVTEPPAWPEVEWCDGGGSCEHAACLDEYEPDDRSTAGWP